MKASTSAPRGTRDFLAQEVERRAFVVQIIEEVYRSYGFGPLETPAFERLETLLGKYGDEGDQLVFKILRRGQSLVTGVRTAAEMITQPGVVQTGRSGETAPAVESELSDLGLRYDLTVPLARVVADQRGKLPMPYRRYQIQPVWRADTPAKGRFREFYQCDVDVVGTHSRGAEVEVASAVSECLDRLGFASAQIKMNHRGLLRAVMRVAGVPSDREVDAIGALDKLDKVGTEGVRQELSAKGIEEAAQAALLNTLTASSDLESIEKFVSNDEEGRRSVEDLRTIDALSEGLAAASRLVFDPTLARGLGYYTGAIFEISVPEFGGSLGGGGRYDGLVGMFSGQSVPACGFSIGLERILVVMEEQAMFPPRVTRRRVLVAPSDPQTLPRVLSLGQLLRGRGLVVETWLEKTKPGRVRKEADERGFGCAVIVTDVDSDAPVGVWMREEPDVKDRTLSVPDLIRTLQNS